MNQNAYAILIGVNHSPGAALSTLTYAEKDCVDLRSVLADPQIGEFPLAHTILLKGPEATTKDVKRLLQREVVTKRGPEDTVLVYFSGHGFVRALDDKKRTYFGTTDSSIEDIIDYPTEGLDMSFLHNEIFLRTRARIVILILDCCHSGAIVPDQVRGPESRAIFDPGEAVRHSLNLVTNEFTWTGTGRVALVACPADSVSRESRELRNGVFTYYILSGLRGDAAEPTTGEVTLDSLTNYLRSNVPAHQPPGRYGQDFGRVVLTRPGKRPIASAGDLVIRRTSVSEAVQNLSISDLHHPLEEYGRFIQRIVAGIEQSGPESARDADSHLLEAIRREARADLVFLMSRENDNLVIRSQSERSPGGEDVDQIVSLIPPRILDENVTRRSNHGLSIPFKSKRSKTIVVVPTTFEPGSDLIVICGMNSKSDYHADAFGTTLAAIIAAHRRLRQGDKTLFEPTILDELRDSYGFLPASIYNRRRSLFHERMAKMTVYFQPVICLHPKDLGVDSWEALARDPTDGTTPFDLFRAAELWGREFMVELDRHFLMEETTKYRLKPSAGNGTPSLSINVYPQSLMSEEYFHALQSTLASGVIRPDKLILEISEKVPIYSRGTSEYEEEQVLLAFRKRLESHVEHLRISFAIDDFGVRLASVSHLARLNPSHVKIDRDALLHQYSDLIIRFVLALTSRGRLESTNVVVEGFHTDSRVTLVELYRMGVRYVQGFSIAMPSPEPCYLDDAKLKELRLLVEEAAGNVPLATKA